MSTEEGFTCGTSEEPTRLQAEADGVDLTSESTMPSDSGMVVDWTVSDDGFRVMPASLRMLSKLAVYSLGPSGPYKCQPSYLSNILPGVPNSAYVSVGVLHCRLCVPM